MAQQPSISLAPRCCCSLSYSYCPALQSLQSLRATMNLFPFLSPIRSRVCGAILLTLLLTLWRPSLSSSTPRTDASHCLFRSVAWVASRAAESSFFPHRPSGPRRKGARLSQGPEGHDDPKEQPTLSTPLLTTTLSSLDVSQSSATLVLRSQSRGAHAITAAAAARPQRRLDAARGWASSLPPPAIIEPAWYRLL